MKHVTAKFCTPAMLKTVTILNLAISYSYVAKLIVTDRLGKNKQIPVVQEKLNFGFQRLKSVNMRPTFKAFVILLL
jgi:hypothetical protein